MRDRKRKRQRKKETLMTFFEPLNLTTYNLVNQWNFQLGDTTYILYIICFSWVPV